MLGFSILSFFATSSLLSFLTYKELSALFSRKGPRSTIGNWQNQGYFFLVNFFVAGISKACIRPNERLYSVFRNGPRCSHLATELRISWTLLHLPRIPHQYWRYFIGPLVVHRCGSHRISPCRIT